MAGPRRQMCTAAIAVCDGFARDCGREQLFHRLGRTNLYNRVQAKQLQIFPPLAANCCGWRIKVGITKFVAGHFESIFNMPDFL